MTKAEIVEALYDKMGCTKKEAADLAETVLETIREELSNGNEVKLSGFGNFALRDKNSRVGRNPKTGEAITITARKVLTFKPSQILHNKINSSE